VICVLFKIWFLGDDGNRMWCLYRAFVCIKMSKCVWWVDLCGVVCSCGCECFYLSCLCVSSVCVYQDVKVCVVGFANMGRCNSIYALLLPLIVVGIVRTLFKGAS